MSIFSKSNSVYETYSKDIQKNYLCNNQELIIRIMGAKYAQINGKEELLDSELVNKSVDAIAQSITSNLSKYNTLPNKVIIHHNDESEESSKNEEKVQIINCYEPKYTLDEIYLDEKAKQQILSSLVIKKYHNKLFNDWGLSKTLKNDRAIIFNFFGPPGTGKSMTAEAIASYLGKKVCLVNYSELESKYVGETPKNISNVFKEAKKNDAVIIFDEADSFLGKRLTNVTQSADYGVNITRSVMLLELEKFDGIIVFTTNLIKNYDDAFKRRILSSIEFKLPDIKGRLSIWKYHIPRELPLDTDINFNILARIYDNISGADIKDILLFASVNALQRKSDKVSKQDFDLAYNYVKSRYSLGEESVDMQSQIISDEQYKKEINQY
ncbi:ATP-binding protein [Romboutsia sp.]|uniref:ATP-binding protein n=1 Tax=Romboutsia sp. TaxID=1965302 RepID=UPI003F33DC5B